MVLSVTFSPTRWLGLSGSPYGCAKEDLSWGGQLQPSVTWLALRSRGKSATLVSRVRVWRHNVQTVNSLASVVSQVPFSQLPCGRTSRSCHMRICCCMAVVTDERHKGSLLPLNARRPFFAWRSTFVGVGTTVANSVGGALLGNVRSLPADDWLLHVDAVLTGRVKPAPVTKTYEERVERAAAATSGLAQKVLYSTLVNRARWFGSHGTALRSSIAVTWSMGWVRRSDSLATPPPGGQSEVFSRIGWHGACQAARDVVTN